MRLLSGLGNPDLCHELDSDPLGTVEVGEGWTEERREALGAVGRWSKMSRLIIDSNCVIVHNVISTLWKMLHCFTDIMQSRSFKQ